MKIILILCCMLTLAACDPMCPTKPEDETSHQLVTKKIPPELLDIPASPAGPDLEGSQKDIALWIIENEKRTQALENQIIKIKEYTEE